METEPTNQTPETEGRRSGTSRNLLLTGAAVVAIAVLFVGLFIGGGEEVPPVEVDEELAQLVFTNPDGTAGTLADYRGEPLVLNFFAAWCGPCRAELPEFEEVAQANLDDVTFLGISHDLDEAQWQSLLVETGVTFDTVFQPDAEIWAHLDARGMPSTVFISPEGEVLELWTGILSDERLQELIDEHLVEA